MECRYCQAANDSDDHRCRRCGRRIPAGSVYTGSSAAAPVLQYGAAPVLQYGAAPVLQYEAAPILHLETEPVADSGPMEVSRARHRVASRPEPSAPRPAITYQPSLFTSRELPAVVPFETIAPGFAPGSPRKPQTSTPRQRRRRPIPGQQALEFTQESTQAPRSPGQCDGVIFCDSPVAVPARRIMAAALDGAILVIAFAIFAMVFRLVGGVVALNIKTAPMFLGVAIGIVIFYRLLWCLANGDTAGQKMTRLRLVNFDGQPPTRKQRFYRTSSGFLSLMAGGIGILWGLVDEETLTWHDHISKTFPTPVA